MPSLLIRDIDATTKKRLAVRAAENGRSQQAEALAILENSLGVKSSSWFDALREASNVVGGIDLPSANRHHPRITGTLL